MCMPSSLSLWMFTSLSRYQACQNEPSTPLPGFGGFAAPRTASGGVAVRSQTALRPSASRDANHGCRASAAVRPAVHGRSAGSTARSEPIKSAASASLAASLTATAVAAQSPCSTCCRPASTSPPLNRTFTSSSTSCAAAWPWPPLPPPLLLLAPLSPSPKLQSAELKGCAPVSSSQSSTPSAQWSTAVP